MADARNLDPAVDLELAAFTRQLHSGLFVPEAEQATAPIDVVDRRPAPPTPTAPTLAPPSPPAAVAGSAAAQPLTEHPAPPNQKPRTADERAEPWKRPPAPKLPQPTGPSGWQRAGHALADWIELRTQRTRTRRATPAEDSDITVGALIVVSVVTLVVCALAFALSFSMMLAAARLYGWNDNLAKLFPILIDVGAIGGTFMGAISANRTYVHVGRSVLTLTLAASVLFNLVGHDVRGGTLIALPERWKWTGTVAAVFIPIVLAYFVHAFSKALKAYMDQRRAQKAAAEAAATAKARRAEAERAQQRQLPVAPVADRVTAPVAAMPPARVVEQPKPPAPAPVAVPQQRPAARPVPPKAAPAKAAAPRKAEAAKSEAAPAASAPAKPASKAKPGKLDADTAYAWSRRNGHPGPTVVLKHFEQQGFEVPALSTLRSWINSRRDTEAGSTTQS
ncbi:hypothetical protein [Amycolatopsis australiensis]|uniref:DUF2637 domain-containing protein n=1 Tax=Amycolatopsis australiensis TaxID=546364 RepID=A0A1K1LLK8_9PSEU|nr:hypothetical protein [Amycolatopsis australiensis]SFW11781.1 hypothetical protein SAMN04489730_0057 [Amycolatopsis australiensis]